MKHCLGAPRKEQLPRDGIFQGVGTWEDSKVGFEGIGTEMS